MPARARALATDARGRASAGDAGSLRAILRRGHAYALLAALAALPRLVVLLYERGDITAAYVDKGDVFARTFLDDGTYGFIPGLPSAYTQPLYGFFLVPIYWVFERSWVSVGLAHLAVAIATAWLVYEIGRRVFSDLVGIGGAAAATLHPYLIWHDMHMNREVLDQLLAAGIVLLTLVVGERRSLPLALLLGGTIGAAILGNVRLLLLPLVVAAYLVWRVRGEALVPALAVAAAAALVVAPWVVRNRVELGCAAVTTDGRALWKANNPNTLETLRSGGWIDDVPRIPGAPPTPQEAGGLYAATGRVVQTDECAQMRFYRRLAVEFVRDQPGEKAELAALATTMLWQPAVTKTEGRGGAGTWLDTGRDLVEPAYMLVVYALGIVGLWLGPRRFVVLALALLAYTTIMAMAFAGETRYRVPWDFLIVLAAAAAAIHLAPRARGRIRRA